MSPLEPATYIFKEIIIRVQSPEFGREREREREMGRKPCCAKEGLNRGAWTSHEDEILVSYIKDHGEGKWRSLPKRAGEAEEQGNEGCALLILSMFLKVNFVVSGLKRCGKSCRLRWLNYLRPGIKRGNISDAEEELIIRLHNLLGNR